MITNHSQVLVTYSHIAVKGEHQGLTFRSINVSVKLLYQQFSLTTEMEIEIGKPKRMMKVQGKILLYKTRKCSGMFCSLSMNKTE